MGSIAPAVRAVGGARDLSPSSPCKLSLSVIMNEIKLEGRENYKEETEKKKWELVLELVHAL